MKTIRVAMLGFGNVGQSFASLLVEKQTELREKFDTEVRVVAITTKTRGIMVDAWGIDLEYALNVIQSHKTFPASSQPRHLKTALDVAETVEYDVLIEMTPLEYASGLAATAHVEAALKRGKDVICTNKGPLAWHYRELTELAETKGCKFMYETTVLDGTPLFSIVRENLKLCKVIEIKGILSRTLNYMLSGMERGLSQEEILEEGKKRGFIEANPQADLTGQESLIKMVALANTLMDADMTPKDTDALDVECSQGITMKDIKDAEAKGEVIKYICRAYRKGGDMKISVKPERISRFDSYASVSGTSLAVSITTDLMGTMTIIEESADVEQTGYGVFADLLTIIETKEA
ncbi:MAG: hypothetical protein IJ070_03480 [Firmicutes bacterium]|nr:hypothetical protein [Bacillota bacterium]